MDTEPIRRFFDRETEPCCAEEGGGEAGVAGISSVLLEALERVGMRGRTVLDLGCGTGGLALEALRRGAARVTGIDLSPVSVEVARRRAADAGLADRAAFEAGDAAASPADPHDVVVLDKSICCYPDVERFVANSADAAGRVYAFSLPASSGLRGVLARAVIFAENASHRVRRDPFRGFVHDVRRIDAMLRSRGFRAAQRLDRWMWHASVYVRTDDSSRRTAATATSAERPGRKPGGALATAPGSWAPPGRSAGPRARGWR